MKILANLLFPLLSGLLFGLLMAGCASAPPAPPAPVQLFSDTRFDAASERVNADQVFAVSPAMHAYLDSTAFRAQVRNKGPERGLVDALYKQGELKLDYDSGMTRNAAQTFQTLSGNCLSLVIMTAAFAKELGLNVNYQGVVVDESWRRAGGLYLASSHVNVSIGRPLSSRPPGVGGDPTLTIDFLPSEQAAGYRTHPLEEAAIVAMYMNNRAVESLLAGRIDNAYWWARAALSRNPGYVVAYNTLGVVYQRHGDGQLAEQSFRAALEREPENLSAMQNLAPLLAALGKRDEAAALAKRVAAIEPHPPFHYFNLGMTAMENRDYVAAKTMFEREVRRAPYYDEFHFWLGIAMLRLGEAAQASEQIALAYDTSTTRDGRAQYSAKLAHLRAQAN
jgi:Tfp pilus assembly protein PilF